MILTLSIISLFVFLCLTPRNCFAMARAGTIVGAGPVFVWAGAGTLFVTLKFLI